MNRFWLVVAVGLAVGCGASAKREDTLVDNVRAYNDGVRWGKYSSAALRIPPLEREDFLDEREALADDLRVDEYEVLRMRFRAERQAARVDVEYTWHLDSRGIVHKTVTRQDWSRLEKLWLMTDETRLRGEPMPGVAEPPDPPENAADEARPKTGKTGRTKRAGGAAALADPRGRGR